MKQEEIRKHEEQAGGGGQNHVVLSVSGNTTAMFLISN
jgi:hypothetical protein